MMEEYNFLKDWPTEKHKMVNSACYRCYARRKRDWVRDAQAMLKKVGIHMAESTLKSVPSRLRNKYRHPRSASEFKGEITERPGKDRAYRDLHCMEDIFIREGNLKYVGLPADNILSVMDRYTDQVPVVCERNKEMALYMEHLANEFRPDDDVSIYQMDIFEFLETTDLTFSVFDLDLMAVLDPYLITRIAEAVKRTSDIISIVNLVSPVGRGNSLADYEQYMPGLLTRAIRGRNISAQCFRPNLGYCDKTPMRYEQLVVRRS